MRQTDVLIVGAGPTGLVLALWLTRLGVRLRIVDKLPGPATTTRAVAVQARTLEFYRQVGLADAVVARDRTDFLALFPMTGDHRVRLVGTIRDDVAHDRDDLSWNDVAQRVIEWMHIHVDRVNWFSTYRVHHRVAERFRDGRAFLVGDAAHIHSPVGGQGMNTGIGDAVNLAWKVAAVVHGKAPAALLDSVRDGADRVRSTARRDNRSGFRRRDEPQRCGPDSAVAHRAGRDPDGFCVSKGAAIALSNGLANRSELPSQQPE